MGMLRLVYVSRPSFDMAPGGLSATFDDILNKSRVNNARDGITGALLVSPSHIVQVLEGRRMAVSLTMGRIMRDERHHAIEIVEAVETPERMFERWQMCFGDLDRVDLLILRRYALGRVFNPRELSPGALLSFMREAAVDRSCACEVEVAGPSEALPEPGRPVAFI